MIRRIIRINEEACCGCGLCAEACHEGAIDIVNGKARLAREDYCDGLGDCLPECPTGAITFEEREAPAYNEAAVLAAKNAKSHGKGACPSLTDDESRRSSWPIQIRLVPENAPFFDGGELLVAADCTAYAYAGMHREYMSSRVTLIGCPKLDPVDYAEKLTAIMSQNDIKSVTVARMEVPCCGGLERAAAAAVARSGSSAPFRVVTISVDGKIL